MKHPNSSKLASSYLAPLLKLCWGKATYIRNDGFGNLHLILFTFMDILMIFFSKFNSKIETYLTLETGSQDLSFYLFRSHGPFSIEPAAKSALLAFNGFLPWYDPQKVFLLFVSGCAFRVQSDDNLNEWRGQPYPLAVVQQSKKVAAWQWLVLYSRQSRKWKIMLHVLNHSRSESSSLRFFSDTLILIFECQKLYYI